MGNNKVSEKAVWEGSISPDNDTPSIGSQMQTQPQMMFCYKCNNVIPADSKFCPCCNVELYTTCPKCGVKYSSKYSICSQCGTNREEYLQIKRKEAERKAAIERENKRRQEIEERKRIEEERKRKEAEEEKERQERLKRYEQQANERQQKDAYLKENAEIKETEEYKMTYSILNEAFENYEKRVNNMGCILVPLYVIIIMLTLFCIHPVLGFILMIVLPFLSDKNNCQKRLQTYISERHNYNNKMVTSDLINMVSYQGKERLSDCCIIAYRKKHNLTINYKWHNLRTY